MDISIVHQKRKIGLAEIVVVQGGELGGMGETVQTDVLRKDEEYRGSPTPFVFFLALFLVFLALAILAFPPPRAKPHEYMLSVLFGIIAFVSLMFLPATVAINKEWEEAIILRFGKFQRLVGPGFFFKWPFAENFLKQDKRIVTLCDRSAG